MITLIMVRSLPLEFPARKVKFLLMNHSNERLTFVVLITVLEHSFTRLFYVVAQVFEPLSALTLIKKLICSLTMIMNKGLFGAWLNNRQIWQDCHLKSDLLELNRTYLIYTRLTLMLFLMVLRTNLK